MGLIIAIIVGGLAGWIASIVMKANTGIIINVILGIIGAFVGVMLLSSIGFSTSERSIANFLVAVLGACILIWGYRLIKK